YVIQATGNFWLALLVAPLVVGLLGIVLEFVALQSLHGKPAVTIIATFALMLIIQQLVLMYFGGTPQSVDKPWQGSVEIGDRSYPTYRLLVAGLSAAMLLAVGMLLYRTKLGLWIRAVRQNQELALTLGIPVPVIYSAVFGMGSALAAFAGVLASPIVSVDHQMGLDILITAFIVVIVGGLGSLKGALIAAIFFSLLEGFLTAVPGVDQTLAHLVALLAMGAVLLRRPHGFFPSTAVSA
ncbi:branched-chain amino acid ABC transporter permease, partial [Candidatus Acetothermia bacterium]|nr:branched-chain amino acid ABC transporter permease [Candidatus Acetothermia bacterium]